MKTLKDYYYYYYAMCIPNAIRFFLVIQYSNMHTIEMKTNLGKRTKDGIYRQYGIRCYNVTNCDYFRIVFIYFSFSLSHSFRLSKYHQI